MEAVAAGTGTVPRWRELALVVAGTSWDGIWMSERHVAMNLADRLPVLWVDPPVSVLSPIRNGAPAAGPYGHRLRPAAPNVLRLTPMTVPGVSRPVLRDIGAAQARRAVRRAVARTGARVRCTIVAGLADMLDVVPAQRRIFYGTDDFTAGAELLGMDVAWLRRAELRQVRRADTVIVTSPVLARRWTSERPDVVMIPNGCDVAHFAGTDEAALPADVQLPRPVAGFVGHMSERIDVAMLEAVAEAGVSLLLVGPRQPTFEISKLDALLARPNVQWVGPKPFAELPSYLRAMDVGLTPYARSDFNLASFPLKTLEYLAAGRPVVASDLPAHRWLDTAFVQIASTPAAFAARTREVLSVPADPEDAAARRAFAAQHSWAARARDIWAALELDPAADVARQIA
jgi:teichuronic acid biosynthesis glycosyltransferase TuaH